MTTILLVIALALSLSANSYLIKRKPAIGFEPETGTLYRFKLSKHSKEYYAIYLNANQNGHARVCSPYAWRNRTQNPDGTFEVDKPFTVPMNSLYK